MFTSLVVTSLRKEEKAAAIKIKREEVEALRRALEKSSQQNKPILTAPISGGMFGLIDDANEGLREGEVSDLPSGPRSFRRSAQSYRQQEPRGTPVDRSSSLVEASNTCDGDVEQNKPKANDDPKSLATGKKTRLLESPAPHVGPSDQQSQIDHRKLPNSRNSSGDRSLLRPPVADASPPLSARTPERKEGRRRWSEEDSETTGKVGKGETVAVGTSKGREDARPARGREQKARVERVEEIPGHTDSDEAAISDNPLHR